MKRILVLGATLALTLACAATAQSSSSPSAQKTVEADGTAIVPTFRLPPSVYSSQAAKDKIERDPVDWGVRFQALIKSGEIPKMRASAPQRAAKENADMAQAFGVRIEPASVAGVEGLWVRVGKRPTKTMLLNLPAGAFIFGSAHSSGMKESIPLAKQLGVDILSITYRQAPEAVFPAASEDVEKVYRELLKSRKSQNIGIFGSSAGGLLTAQSMAWLDSKKLPLPGAVGIFCASADARWAGDSWYWHKAMQGLSSQPTLDERFYYADHPLSDPLMSPIESDAILAKFPPTLLLSATRAGEMSAAVNTHRLLVRNSVDTELHMWDGLNHCFFNDWKLPESKEAVNVMTGFFSKHLIGKARK